jgi:hypothetical protein
MQNKYRYLPIIVLGVVLLSGYAVVSFAKEQRESSYAVSMDYDQDGLSNEEEELYGTDPDIRDTDGDGYSDRVEVESGYDPLVPAPGDRISGVQKIATAQNDAVSSGNMTDEFATRVAGVTLDAFNDTGELDMNAVQKEIDAVIGDSVSFDDLATIDLADVRVKKQDYSDLSKKEREAQIQEDVVDYMTAFSYILSVHAPINIRVDGGADAVMNELLQNVNQFSTDFSNMYYFTDMAQRGEKMLSELYDLEVPEVMVPLHVKGLQLAQYTTEMGSSFTVDEDDPLAMITEIARVQALMMLSAEFFDEATAELEAYGIEDLFL